MRQRIIVYCILEILKISPPAQIYVFIFWARTVCKIITVSLFNRLSNHNIQGGAKRKYMVLLYLCKQKIKNVGM